MVELEKEGFQAKDAMNVKKDASKLERSWILERAADTWTFYCSHRHDTFIESDIAEEIKQDRLY